MNTSTISVIIILLYIINYNVSKYIGIKYMGGHLVKLLYLIKYLLLLLY